MSLHQKIQTRDLINSQNVSSRSSSYYELDINYSPRKEKLYLQLQSVNKGKLGDGAEHCTLHHIPSVRPIQSPKRVTEDIKDKFLEEIMPIYINYIANKKNKVEKTAPQAPVNYCGFDVNVSSDIRQPIVLKINDKKITTSIKTNKELAGNCPEKEIKVNVVKQSKGSSKSYAVNVCPTTTDDTLTVPKKKTNNNKGGAHKEKGKLTTRKIPQAAVETDETSQNNSGDATLQTTPCLESNDTAEDVLTTSVSSKEKNRKNVKIEKVTVATQVKPKELKAINIRTKLNDSTTDEQPDTSTVQAKNKEVYFILVSQSGFEKNKPIKIPINAKELQRKFGFEGCNLVKSQRNDVKRSHGHSTKIIQAKMEDTSVSVRTSSFTHILNVKSEHSKRVKTKIDADIDSEEDPDYCKRRTKKRRREITHQVTDSSSTNPTPKKDRTNAISIVDTTLATKTIDRDISSRNQNPYSSIISSTPQDTFPPDAFSFQDHPCRESIKTISKTKSKIAHGVSKSTNTENQFFLEQRICFWGDKKTDVPVQVKNTKRNSSDNRTNERVLRTEISFTDLNLTPVLSYYMNPTTINDISRTASALFPHRIREPCDLVRYYASARRNASKIQHRPRNSMLMQNTVEASRKACSEVSTSGGYEVEGIEPPKKIGFDAVEKPNTKSRLCSSHFPVIEIIPENQSNTSGVETLKIQDGMSSKKPLDVLETAAVVEAVSQNREMKVSKEGTAGLQKVLHIHEMNIVKEEQYNNLLQYSKDSLEIIDGIVSNEPVAKSNNSSKKGKSRGFRPFVTTKWRWYIPLLKRHIRQRTRTVSPPKPTTLPVDDHSQQTVKQPAINLDCITEESHSHMSTDVDRKEVVKQVHGKLPVRNDIVKNMKKADKHLASTIDTILKMGDTNNKKFTVGAAAIDQPQDLPLKIEIRSKGRDSERITKVSLLSETEEKKSTRTRCTSIPSRPSCSSDESGNITNGKRKRKRRFRPAIPIRACRMQKSSTAMRKMEEETPEFKVTPCSLVKIRSSAQKSFWGKAQKRSSSSVTTKIGPSLKSTQLFVNCKHKSTTSSRTPLASTCLFTKDYRVSKTKLSAFQKRKLYGEYLRKAATQNHSVHSICQIIVCDKSDSEIKYSKKKIKKSGRNKEMKLFVRESPIHRFRFHNIENSSKNSTSSSKKTATATPIKQMPKNIGAKTTVSAVRRITTLSLNKAKMKLINPASKRNCCVLVEVFNNKHFEADSTSSVSNKDSDFVNLFRRSSGEQKSMEDSLENCCSDRSTASDLLEETEKKLETTVLSNHARNLLNNLDSLDYSIPKTPAKSCENSFVQKRHGIFKKLGLAEWKLAKSFSYCDILRGKVSYIGRVCSPPPDTHVKKSVVTTEKNSVDSLEKYHEHPRTEKYPKKEFNLMNPVINNVAIPRQNVTIVAYNTEIKYEKNKDAKSDAKTDSTEMNSIATVEESGYESNKSKNTIKRLFKKKFNFFKSSKLEIASRDQHDVAQSPIPIPRTNMAGISDDGVEKLDALQSNAGSSVGNDYFCDLSKDKLSLYKISESSIKQSKDASQSSTANDSKEKSGEAMELTKSCVPVKIKIKKNEQPKNSLITWADVCRKALLGQGAIQFCYINKGLTCPQVKAEAGTSTSIPLPCYEYQRQNLKYKAKTPFNKEKKLTSNKAVSKMGEIKDKFTQHKANTRTITDAPAASIYSTENKGGASILKTTSNSKSEKCTNCDLPNISQQEMITYLENRFQELERKIDKVANSTKVLHEAACMCSEHEFKPKSALKTVSVGQNTEKLKEERRMFGMNRSKREMAVGTEDCFKVAKEVNTEKGATKKQQMKKRNKGTEKAVTSKQGKVARLFHKETAVENDKETNTQNTSESQTNTLVERKLAPNIYKSTSTENESIVILPKTKKSPVAQSSDRSATCEQKCSQPDKKCVCPDDFTKRIRSFQKSKSDCQEYAQKVRLESELRKEGHLKSEEDFRELPLSFLLGKADQAIRPQFHTRSSTRTSLEEKPSAPSDETSLSSTDEKTTLSSEQASLAPIAEQENKDEKEEKPDQVQKRQRKASIFAKLRSSVETIQKTIQLDPDFKTIKAPEETNKVKVDSVKKKESISSKTVTKEGNEGKTSNEQFHTQYTDQELFDKLLETYERENDIAERLSRDDEFFQAQLSSVRSKESVERIIKEQKSDKGKKQKPSKSVKHKGSLTEIVPYRLGDEASVDQLDIISTANERVAEHQIEQIEKEIKAMEGKELQGPTKVQFSNTSLFKKGDKQQSDEVITQKFLRGEMSLAPRSTTVEPKEIGKCFRRGFRPDNIVLTGEPCLKVSEKEQRGRVSAETATSFIDFSERDTPLEFLLGLGFSVDEASNAIKDEDVKNRLNAAITEARVWINKINTTQGTMLYLVAFKTRPKTMRYFLQLVEAIINQRIVDAVRLDGFLKLLEKIEEGNVNMVTILGMDNIDDEQNEENMVKKQLRKLFYDVYKIAEQEAAAQKKQLSREAIILLRILAAKYRAGLQPHLELIAKYIGQDLLTNEVQLEAAMIYLARVDTADVNLRDFEEYCAISCKERLKGRDSKEQKK